MSRAAPLAHRATRPQPFTSRQHVLDPDAAVDLNGQHFMTVATKEGADRLAGVLNLVLALDAESHLLVSSETGDPDGFARIKIAGAVAKALGGAIDFPSFRRSSNAEVA